MRRAAIGILFACAVALAGACDDHPGTRCQRDGQCPAGQRCADGVCTPALTRDLGVGEASSFDAQGDQRADAIVGADLFSDASSSCVANTDDQIARSEMPIVVGGKIRYMVGSDLVLDLQGVVQGGKRRWRLKAQAKDDHKIDAELLPVFAWARPKFPKATYVGLLDEGLDTYGVFTATSDALLLEGIVSKQANKTQLSYDKPVAMLRFPIKKSGSSSSASNISGTLNLLPVWLHEKYDVTSHGAGKLELPDITLDALLVQVTVEQYPLANPLLRIKRTTFLFVAECYGIVARALVDGVPSNLSAVRAKERWRLSF